MRQQSFTKTNWSHRYCHGGTLRKSRAGRRARPLSSKDPLHLVFKCNIAALPQGLRTAVTYTLLHQLLRKYARKFFVKIEQFSIQRDHIHLLVRGSKRSQTQHFFRVFAGQAAQRILGTVTGTPAPRLWKHRPWTRVILGFKPYVTVKNYIQLNELEARGEIKYSNSRLAGLRPEEWERLWS